MGFNEKAVPMVRGPARAITQRPKQAGRTMRTKRKPPATVCMNKGPWVDLVPGKPAFARSLHDYFLYEHFDGDVQRLASGHGLFRNDVRAEALAWLKKDHPGVAEWYEKKFGRPMNGKILCTRVRFLYVRYSADGKRKRDGVRSREHLGIVP